MKSTVLVCLFMMVSISCKSQVYPKSDLKEITETKIGTDDCRIKAELISLEEETMSIKMKVIEVLQVGFGFQSSLYKGLVISISYLKGSEAQVKSLKPNDEFIGIITSEPALGENVNLTLKSIDKTGQ